MGENTVDINDDDVLGLLNKKELFTKNYLSLI